QQIGGDVCRGLLAHPLDADDLNRARVAAEHGTEDRGQREQARDRQPGERPGGGLVVLARTDSQQREQRRVRTEKEQGLRVQSHGRLTIAGELSEVTLVGGGY